MTQVTGVVNKVGTKWGKVSVEVGGNWYSTKLEWWHEKNTDLPCQGDEVTFDDGGKNYLKNYQVLNASGNAPHNPVNQAPASGGSAPARTASVSDDARQSAIIRQNALTNAVNYTVGTNAENSPEDVVELAKVFYAYTSGTE